MLSRNKGGSPFKSNKNYVVVNLKITAYFAFKGLDTSKNSRLFSKLKEFLKGPSTEVNCILLEKLTKV